MPSSVVLTIPGYLPPYLRQRISTAVRQHFEPLPGNPRSHRPGRDRSSLRPGRESDDTAGSHAGLHGGISTKTPQKTGLFRMRKRREFLRFFDTETRSSRTKVLYLLVR